MNRRGFMSLLGGGAVAGPGALKGVLSKAAKRNAVGAALPNVPVGVAGGGSWSAQQVLSLIRPVARPSVKLTHSTLYEDVECLRSISRSHKSRMNAERERQANLAYAVGEFIKEQKLDLVGLNEETVIQLAKKAVGE